MHKKPSFSKSNNGPKVIRRPQPNGEKGIKSSISEIVKRVEKGRMDPKTVAWSRETIVRSNLGGFGADKMSQAKAILNRLRKERPYIEDPVDGEFMTSSACLLEGCEGLTFLGEDCDGLVIAFLSAIESVGIEGALVAHSYESHRKHTHVLAAVRDEERGTWVRCDPSTSDPFGTVSEPTRETFYGIPGGQVLGDKNGPLEAAKVPVRNRNGSMSGEFVGVGMPVGLGSTEVEPGLTGISDTFRKYMVDQVRRITQDLADSWKDVRYRHRQLELACEMMEIPLVSEEPSVTGWSESHQAYYEDMLKWVPRVIEYGWDVSTGSREVAWGDEENSTLILGKPGEVYIDINNEGKFIVKDTSSGNLGAHPGLVAGLVIVGVAIKYLAIKEACDVVRKHIDSASMERNQKFISDMIDNLTNEGMDRKDATETALRIQTELNKDAQVRAQSDIEKERISPFTQFTKTADKALSALTIIAIGGAVVYGLTVLTGWSKKTKVATS